MWSATTQGSGGTNYLAGIQEMLESLPNQNFSDWIRTAGYLAELEADRGMLRAKLPPQACVVFYHQETLVRREAIDCLVIRFCNRVDQ